jgi:lysophospholipid acyltransferase (LPLAT)-like uncharacterized protein
MLKWMRQKFITRLSQGAIRLLLWTCKVKIEGLEHFLSAANTGPCVLMLWHDRLALIGPIAWRFAPHLRYAAFVSASRDGKMIHEICASYPHCRVIRVPHDGRHLALREMIQQLRKRQEVLLITPDGPRGPRHKVKPGLGLAARMTQVPVVAFSWSASRFWQLNTWDKFLIPKPFSTITVRFGPALELRKAEDEAILEENLNRLEKEKPN